MIVIFAVQILGKVTLENGKSSNLLLKLRMFGEVPEWPKGLVC